MPRLWPVALLAACAPRPPLIEPAGPPVVRGEPAAPPVGAELGTVRSELAAATPLPVGGIPAALPAQLWVGLGDTEAGAGWMRSARAAGAAFHARYRYLVGGWVNNWNPASASDGRFAARYLEDTSAAGMTPVLTWYRLLALPGGGESSAETYAKVRDPAAQRIYWTEWRTLMTVCKAFGRPVVVHIEPDGYAYLQQASGANAGSYAAVAATGLPELAGLPNTVAGWGQAFGRMRQAVGASNVLLAPHYSTWSTGTEITRGSGLSADVATHVSRTAAFLGALGLYDLVFVEWLDRDAAFRNIWWSTADDAPLNSASFRRSMAVLEALNRATGKRLVLWQVPLGNAHSLNTTNSGQPRGGWKSNHTEWVFGPGGAAHRERLGSVGVVGILFGQGANGQADQRVDVGADGGLYVRGAVADYLKPGLPVCTAGTPGGLSLPR